MKRMRFRDEESCFENRPQRYEVRRAKKALADTLGLKANLVHFDHLMIFSCLYLRLRTQQVLCAKLK